MTPQSSAQISNANKRPPLINYGTDEFRNIPFFVTVQFDVLYVSGKYKCRVSLAYSIFPFQYPFCKSLLQCFDSGTYRDFSSHNIHYDHAKIKIRYTKTVMSWRERNMYIGLVSMHFSPRASSSGKHYSSQDMKSPCLPHTRNIHPVCLLLWGKSTVNCTCPGIDLTKYFLLQDEEMRFQVDFSDRAKRGKRLTVK